MKFNYSKFLLTLVMFTVSFATFAQAPDPDSLVGGGDPPAPINSKLIYLAIIGIAFAYYQFNANRKRA
ncbi:MAG: hypothetical protein PSV16_00030 [Flavobacterium sp.]|nr:hypothetical protein [Flavobacterium sp.]